MGQALVILDSVAAAQDHLARNAGLHDAELVSTHYSVVGFCRARGLVCRDFSDFIDSDAVSAAIRDASAELEMRLGRLDETVGAAACAAGGLPPLALFHAAFKYLGRYNLAGLRCFEEVLTKQLAQSGVQRVHFHQALSTSVDPVFSFVDAARRVCEERGITFTAAAVVPTARARWLDACRKATQLGWRVLHAPDRALVRAARRLKGRRLPRIAGGSAPVAVLIDPQRESFFESALSSPGAQFAYAGPDGVIVGSESFRTEARAAAGRMQTALEDWLRKQPQGDAEDIERRCVTRLACSAAALFEPLSLACQFLRTHPVTVAAWDLPVVTRLRLNLLVELFLNSGIPVLGRQHGASYVDQRLGSIHFDSDFNRCTHYFSYGFGPQEFATAYPGARHRCSFTPAGNPPRVFARGRTASVDIVFPITNCVPLFYLARMPESELARRQALILQAMESRGDLKCVVKPPPGFGPDNFGHIEALAALRRVRVGHASWTEYLARERPRLVIFETASTPLLEVLPFDVDIFLMLDPLFPFTEGALAMLGKRAHIFPTPEALADAIGRYGLDPVTRLRDSTYYDTYVNRGSAAVVADQLAGLRPELVPCDGGA